MLCVHACVVVLARFRVSLMCVSALYCSLQLTRIILVTVFFPTLRDIQ